MSKSALKLTFRGKQLIVMLSTTILSTVFQGYFYVPGDLSILSFDSSRFPSLDGGLDGDFLESLLLVLLLLPFRSIFGDFKKQCSIYNRCRSLII